MRPLQITLISLLSCSIMLGQGNLIYSFESDSHPSPARENIISYDYLTKKKDTVFSNPSNWGNGNLFRTTIDPFSGRYFFVGKIAPHTGINLYSFNLNNLSLTRLTELSVYPYNLEYDMFSNSIIYMEINRLKRFDLNTNTDTTLTTLTNFNSIIWGINRGYNPFKEQYFYLSYNGSVQHLYVFDIRKNSLVDSTLIPTGMGLNYLKFDLRSKEYYGVMNYGHVVKVNPHPFKMESIFQISDFKSHLNSQQPVFDPNNGYYILPYINISNKYRLVIIDVVNKKLVQNVSFFKRSNAHELYSKYAPSLRWDGTRLTSTFGNTYTWYRNDSIIGANTQSYVPDKKGSYKVSIGFPQYESFTSEIIVDSTMISHVKILQDNSLNTVKIFPNPSQGILWIQVDEFSETLTVEIYNVFGNLVRKWEMASTTEKVEIGSMLPGVYLLKVSSPNKVSTTKVVLFE